MQQSIGTGEMSVRFSNRHSCTLLSLNCFWWVRYHGERRGTERELTLINQHFVLRRSSDVSTANDCIVSVLVLFGLRCYGYCRLISSLRPCELIVSVGLSVVRIWFVVRVVPSWRNLFNSIKPAEPAAVDRRITFLVFIFAMNNGNKSVIFTRDSSTASYCCRAY